MVATAALASAGFGTLVGALVTLGVSRRERARRRQAEARLSRTLQSTDQADSLIAIFDRRGRIEYVSRAVELATGYTGRELVRRSGPRWFPWYADEAKRAELRAAVRAGGSFQGTVQCRRKDGVCFLLQENVAPLREGGRQEGRFVSTARDITRQKQLEARVAYLMRFDRLTRVANRAHFAELLQHELDRTPAGERRLAVLRIDVDRFKYLNDLFTPEVGDGLLRRVADVLRSLAGEGGIVGRLGSDEFGMVHLAGSKPIDADALAQRVRAAVARETVIGTQALAVNLAVGVAISPDDGNDAATLLKNADIALSRAMSPGRSSVQVFNRQMGEASREAYSLQKRLIGALRNGEYAVHYQPYFDLVSGRVGGAEALIRWNDGGAGLVYPARFIRALEESGLIVGVGEWVLQAACRQIKEWTLTRRPFPVAVNLSQVQFSQRDLVGMITDAIREHDIEPRRLTLELTESICIQDVDFAIDLLTKLKGVGVSISVDDFGTGYSSLSYVKRLPVDNLKIDMSFVRDVARDPDAASIITAITGMARSLGLKTIAEGVESEEQRNVLRLLRCDMGQGFHFSHAVAPQDLTHLAAE